MNGYFYPHMMGLGYGGMFSWLFCLIIIAAVIYALTRSFDGRGQAESALDALKKRYARGEITKEEFDRTKQDLK